jgi:L-seryl-tRNA(Ser) seleniumtransferase
VSARGTPPSSLARIPSVDRLLGAPATELLVATYGRAAVLAAVREELEAARRGLTEGGADAALEPVAVLARCRQRLEKSAQASLRPVFNLTGTVLHTNLGRATLPEAAIDAVRAVLAQPANLEFDLESGRRGERDGHVERLLCELTGAEAACVVNNNAAALFIVLATFAARKEVPVSRGELIEIGGSFRLPDIMAAAGCRLREVGTTNRTHLADYEQAIGKRTALLLKVHRSNFAIRGFTAEVPEPALAELAHSRGLAFAVDLGSGALADMSELGLPREETPAQALANGADLVTFSGDKLLGGPQAGLIVGRAGLVRKIAKNPLKRALRVGKMTLAGMEAVLRLYRDPERARQAIPVLALLARPRSDIEAQAQRLAPKLQAALPGWEVTCEPCASQVGSGALPEDLLASACLAVRPTGNRGSLERLHARFRSLPLPVIGRIAEGALRFDLRCLGDEAAFAAQLRELRAA